MTWGSTTTRITKGACNGWPDRTGWWDTAQPDSACTRDYYLASSPGAGLLWVFRARHADDTATPAWFLHGLFA